MVSISRRLHYWLRLVVFFWVVWLISPPAWADHIIGGELNMRSVGGAPGLFRVQMKQYWDRTRNDAGNQDPTVRLLIYRKKNPVLMEILVIKLKETLPFVLGNVVCSQLRNLDYTEARYYESFQFDPAKYDDPGGYYIVWERCCRNEGLTNVVSVGSAGVGMVFYLEFPPMMKNGAPFLNSMPEFKVPNGGYMCVNKPFTFDDGAVDADGDQLRYSLVIPLNGYTTRTSLISTDDTPRSAYPGINWAPGINLNNIIPGTPPLSINPTTGVLSIQATRQGLYLFTVQCEEFRNGERISVVRRDLQLPVVDCAKNTPPPAVITINDVPLRDTVLCSNEPLLLTIEKNPAWSYQWQKNGINLPGDTTSTLRIRESGSYTVVKSRANVCANDTVSRAARVTFGSGATPVKLSIINPKPAYCAGDTLTLKAEGSPGAQYQWSRNGSDLVGEKQATIRVYQSGQYKVFVGAATCGSEDSLTLTINDQSTIQITAPRLALCPGDSIQMQASPKGDYRYQWRKDGNPVSGTNSRLTVRELGTYQLTATGTSGCPALSNTLTVKPGDPPMSQITAARTSLCRNDSVQIVGDNPGDYRYQWQRDGILLSNTGNRLTARQPGTYVATVTGPTGCSALSNRLTLTPSEGPMVRLDSVPPVCSTSDRLIPLQGYPAGGVYAGAGVTGDRFDPVAAGVGRHKLTYTVTSHDGCQSEQTRWIVVSSGVKLTGRTSYRIVKGDTAQLLVVTDGPVRRYRWEPPASLTRSDIPNPVANPLQTTTYEVTAVSDNGCESTLSVLVEVADRIFIPSAFSPNADGFNDAWVIANIGLFEQCEVAVFNRWGEQVFYSKGYERPWDGTYTHRQERVEAGVYAYRIRTSAGTQTITYQGQLMVIW